jgi:2-dehydro-3-deoxyphosphogalactonate aldolase
MTAIDTFQQHLHQLPLIAILRGLTPLEAPAIGRALADAGLRILEVPLNSPEPLESIHMLAQAHADALVGAGTVLTAAQVREVHAAGGQLIVSPNFDAQVVRRRCSWAWCACRASRHQPRRLARWRPVPPA